MPTSSGALMATNSPRPSPLLFSDQAVARSPSVSAESFFSNALDADVARSTRTAAGAASPVAARVAVIFTARLRSSSPRFCTGAPRTSSSVAGSSARAATSVGRPQRVTSARRSPTSTRAPPLGARSTITRGAVFSPSSPRGTPVHPLHTTTGSAALARERPRDEQDPGGSLDVTRHVDPRDRRPPSSVRGVNFASSKRARGPGGGAISRPPSAAQGAAAQARTRAPLVSTRSPSACWPGPAGRAAARPAAARAGAARVRAARTRAARSGEGIGRTLPQARPRAETTAPPPSATDAPARGPASSC